MIDYTMSNISFKIWDVASEDTISVSDFKRLPTHRQLLCLGAGILSNKGGYTIYKEMPSTLTQTEFILLAVWSLDGFESKKYHKEILRMCREMMCE